MLDIKFVRANPDAVKENIKKKFQDEKLVLVDEVLELDQQYREATTSSSRFLISSNTLGPPSVGTLSPCSPSRSAA